MTRYRTLLVALLSGVLALLVIGGASMAATSRPTAAANPAAGPGEHGGPDDPNCEDGVSNDDDALIDAADPDCTKPGCVTSSQTPNKCFETNDDDGTGPTPGTCADTIDNEPDGFTDGADPDCQVEGCVQEGVNTCDETNDDSGGGPTPGTCADTLDNEPDGFTDGADPDCQVEGCVQEGVNTCDETNDDSGGGSGENCVATADHGLLTADTLAETAWNGGLNTFPIAGLFEDPERNGAISGPLGEAFNAPPAAGTPIETLLGDEVPCVIDLLIDETVAPGDL